MSPQKPIQKSCRRKDRDFRSRRPSSRRHAWRSSSGRHAQRGARTRHDTCHFRRYGLLRRRVECRRLGGRRKRRESLTKVSLACFTHSSLIRPEVGHGLIAASGSPVNGLIMPVSGQSTSPSGTAVAQLPSSMAAPRTSLIIPVGKTSHLKGW